MSVNQDRNRSLLINPLPIIMVLLLAAGVLVKNIPLESARPSDVERVKFVPIGEQNVEARLWQDPFAAIEKHEERFTQTAVQQQTEIISQAAALKSEKLSGDVRGYRIDGNVKVLAVSVFGGSFAEAAESRRRTRFAVVSALGFHGYSPKNSDAIGYFRLDQGRSDSESENIAIDHQVKQITIPFEWFEKSNQPTSKVLLLWLNESLWLQESKDEPDLVYGKLFSLFEELTVVGPAGSGMLMELASR
jgi:hypothetical protein